MTPRRTSRFTSLSFVPRYRHAARRTRQGLAGSWGTPCVRLPCSTTPSRSPRLAWKDDRGAGSCCLPARRCLIPSLGRCLAAFAARRCCPRVGKLEGTRVVPLSKLNPTAFALAVYASHAPSRRNGCRRTQDSLPGGWPTLSGGRAPARFESFHLHDLLLSRLFLSQPQGGSSSHGAATRLLQAIGRRGGWSLDALIEKLELPAHVVAAALTQLELGGRIRYRDFAYHPI